MSWKVQNKFEFEFKFKFELNRKEKQNKKKEKKGPRTLMGWPRAKKPTAPLPGPSDKPTRLGGKHNKKKENGPSPSLDQAQICLSSPWPNSFRPSLLLRSPLFSASVGTEQIQSTGKKKGAPCARSGARTHDLWTPSTPRTTELC